MPASVCARFSVDAVSVTSTNLRNDENQVNMQSTYDITYNLVPGSPENPFPYLSSGSAFPFLVPVCACVSAPHLTLGTNPFGTHSQLPASVDSSWVFFLSSSNDFRYSTPFLMLLCDGCTFLPASVCVRASLWMQSQ